MPAEPFTIRPASSGDLDDLLSLFEQLNEINGFADLPHAPDVLAAIVEQPSRHLVVAVVGGTVVGTADVVIAANLTHAARPWALIENVVVDGAHRRRGIGAALIRDLIGLAREAGCYRILLTSDKGREDAHAFYRRLGFEAVSEGFKFYLEDDVFPSDDS